MRYLFVILMALVFIASGCTEVDQDPDQTAESYVNNLVSADFEAAYGHLSDEVQNNVSLEEFTEDMNSTLAGRHGISYRPANSKIIDNTEGIATVEVTLEANLWQTKISETETELNLKETDIGAWELQSYWRPFEEDLDSGSVDKAIEDSIVRGSSDWNNFVEAIDYIDVESGGFQEKDLNNEFVSYLREETPYTVKDLRTVEIEVTSTEPGFIGDDYLMMQWVATDAFEESFITHPTIRDVKVKVGKQVENEYGNTDVETLGVAQMNRDTASQINWPEFEYKNLNEVTYVNFQGESLRQDLERYEEYGTTW